MVFGFIFIRRKSITTQDSKNMKSHFKVSLKDCEVNNFCQFLKDKTVGSPCGLLEC